MDLSNLLLPICAFSCVCVGLIGLLAALVLTITGRSVLPMITDLIGGSDEEDELLYGDAAAKRAPRRTGSSLRSRKQSLDFDAAVQRHSDDGTPSAQSSIPKGRIDLDSAPPRRLSGNSSLDEYRNSGSGLRKRRGAEDGDFEIYEEDGGFFDDF